MSKEQDNVMDWKEELYKLPFYKNFASYEQASLQRFIEILLSQERAKVDMTKDGKYVKIGEIYMETDGDWLLLNNLKRDDKD